MKDNSDRKYILLDHEKRFLELYGKAFELRRSRNFGRIFALLSLKASTEEKGLDQQDIVKFINNNVKDDKEKISISTVSRTLNKMEKSKYCSSTPSSGKGRRKYYSGINFSKLAIDRIEVNVREGSNLLKELDNLKNSLPSDDSDQFKEFIVLVDNLKQVYEVVTKYYEDLLLRITDRMNEINNP